MTFRQRLRYTNVGKRFKLSVQCIPIKQEDAPWQNNFDFLSVGIRSGSSLYDGIFITIFNVVFGIYWVTGR